LSTRALQLALTILAGFAGFACPVLPFLRRRAWHCAGLVGLIWAALVAIFFLRAAGAAFVCHMGLAILGAIALTLPRALDRLEKGLSRGRRLIRARLLLWARKE
jgi:asparagine N-glycosylation enzyme membrane subunit Stt3